ncbi:glucose 1-dehydrogenase [Polyangium jinanense]|uniref:Glucose 1-dehydrogenase n=1 Tax=Polyangium jinanense TaxID=2829994 RepID=A0A9X3XIZ2_9BACT|nr:glucose 1-dehydrogenase [Polyangium jinanense]MDC3962137.1 glucose 1-dehydrogenase [Polyangium jinanense]MDC3989553.1 glucose 1-dehydrogenase [Polyangium jinanense]
MQRFERKVALVTGAASGLGAAAVRRLHAEGAVVVITDVAVDRGEALAAELGARAEFTALDVTQEAQWIAVLDAVVAKHGRLDVLVNNAGVGIVGDVESTTLEQWRFVHTVNTDGMFLGCKHAIRLMKERGGGSIVNLSSVAGIIGAPNLVAYSSSKGSVRTFTKSVAMHCARKGYGIRVNSVHPAFIDTPMVDAMVARSEDPARAKVGLAKSIPLGKLGEPEDVAAAIAYLASDDAKFVTGTELLVDGGLLAT